MKHIRLKRFLIQNYRTIRNCDLDLSKGVVGLIGVNGSGKTNIWRAVDFFFRLIRENLNNVQSARGLVMAANQSQKAIEWNPLNDDPRTILPFPQEGQQVSLQLVGEISPLLIPEGKGQRLQNLDRKENHQFKIQCDLEVRELSTGDLKLMPRFSITIHEASLPWGDLQVLSTLWALFKTARINAQSPPDEFLGATLELREKNVDGHIAFNRVNEKVITLDQNFARVSFIRNTPTAIEGEIPDLTLEKMSSGNLRAFHLLSAGLSPELSDALLIHVEEPETNFHPTLQRKAVCNLVDTVGSLGASLIVETHSPEVLAELFAMQKPVYRLDVVQRDKNTRLRKSDVKPLANDVTALDFLRSMGVRAGFAVLGGVIIITDGPTDEPAYRELFDKFEELRELLVSFIPMGCLEAHGLNLSGVRNLSPKVVLIADGHFLRRQDRLQHHCEEVGIVYVPLQRWGVENFFSEEAWRAAEKVISTLKLSDKLTLDPMKKIGSVLGINNFSKTDHNHIVAKHTSKEFLQQQTDFMALVHALVIKPAVSENME